jgi:hypothetical protein
MGARGAIGRCAGTRISKAAQLLSSDLWVVHSDGTVD